MCVCSLLKYLLCRVSGLRVGCWAEAFRRTGSSGFCWCGFRHPRKLNVASSFLSWDTVSIPEGETQLQSVTPPPPFPPLWGQGQEPEEQQLVKDSLTCSRTLQQSGGSLGVLHPAASQQKTQEEQVISVCFFVCVPVLHSSALEYSDYFFMIMSNLKC